MTSHQWALRTPWSWQNYCLNHCTRTCCSRRIVTRCRFTNWLIRCERGGRTMRFLRINLISFRRSHGIVLVMASPAREMDSAGRWWNTEKDMPNVRDFSVNRLPSGGTRRCMPQQTWHAGVCGDWEQKLRVFRSNPYRDWPGHWQRTSTENSTASEIGQIRISLKSDPRRRYDAIRLAPRDAVAEW